MRLIDATEAATFARLHILDAQERCAILDFLRGCATIETEHVRKSYWESYTTSAYIGVHDDGEPKWAERRFFRCEACRTGSAIKTNYCANCGAKMDRRRENNG